MLRWYGQHARTLPWRALDGQQPNPYHVLLSEVMLQQTTVATVKAYFERFIEQWPTLRNLAAASVDEVLVAWQGLGYYSRARNLYKAVQELANLQSFPNSAEGLKQLPGIGDYTANAIAAIVFNQPAVPIDGNVIRVLSRVYGLTQPLPALKKTVTQKALSLASIDRPGDFAQSLMDLGAMVCRARKPICESCPVATMCEAYRTKQQLVLPIKAVKSVKPIRYGSAFLNVNNQGQVWLRRRPEKGLLAGMIEVPSTEWSELPIVGRNDYLCRGIVKHTFTHFHLQLTVYQISNQPDGEMGFWGDTNNLGQYALPTVMKKVLSFLPDN